MLSPMIILRRMAMKDKDLTWDIVNSELIGHRLFNRYCHFNSCCENCNQRVRFWCKVKNRVVNYQEKIIKKELDRRKKNEQQK